MIHHHLRPATRSIAFSALLALAGCGSAPFIGEVNITLAPSLGGGEAIGEEDAATEAESIAEDCPTYKRMPATVKKLIPVVRKSAAPDKAEIEAWIGWLADSVQPFLARTCGPGEDPAAEAAR